MQMTKLATLALVSAAIAMSGAAAAPASGGHERTVHGLTLDEDGRTVSFRPTHQAYIAPVKHEPGTHPLFNNIGLKYPKGSYFCCVGLTISGPASSVGFQSWIAFKFIPGADALVTEIDAAVEHGSGTNEIDIVLYADQSGVPGEKLKSVRVTGLEGISSCCGLAVGKDRSGIAVTGGTPYWVGVITDKAAPDTFAAWVDNTTDEISAGDFAVNSGTGWQSAGSIIPRAAFAVYGR
jgi:opacity protein-like surface antigen